METQMSRWIRLNEVPAGDMVILAIMTYSGYNQEDALILNKRSVDMGKFKMVIYRRYRTVVKEKDPEFREYLGRPNPKPGENPARYRHLDNNGIAAVGSYLKEKDVIIGKLREYIKTKELQNASVELGIGEEGVVDRVLVTVNEDNEKVVTVRLRSVRDPVIGDKFASRYAQKATVGLIVPPEDLPFTERNGVVPDIIINPHCIPSRMTMGKMLEIVASKAAALRAQYIDGTSFREFDVNEFIKVLREYGYDPSGEETMIDGRTGERLSSTIMIGPCYYQALRHHVKDKYFARSSRGPYKALTRQPVGGRVLGGALRTGEMERDVFINHGAAGVLNERLCFSSDAYRTVFCRKCGVIASTEIQQIRYKCRLCQTTDPKDLGICTIPYTFKVITDYLLGAGIKIRLNFELLESNISSNVEFDVKNLGINL
jgi:DNA-directed RNA polymerase beta subunit